MTVNIFCHSLKLLETMSTLGERLRSPNAGIVSNKSVCRF